VNIVLVFDTHAECPCSILNTPLYILWISYYTDSTFTQPLHNTSVSLHWHRYNCFELWKALL